MKNKLKIVLSTTPWYGFFGTTSQYIPTGLSFLAGNLDPGKFDVKIINPDSISKNGIVHHDKHVDSADYEKNITDPDYYIWCELKKFLSENPFDILGISVMITQFLPAHRLAKLAKEINPEAIVVFGGIGVTVKPDLAFEGGSCVDYVIRGEGEISFRALAGALKDNLDIRTIPGLSFKRGGEVQSTPSGPMVKELDTLAHPAKNLYLPIQGRTDPPPVAFGRLFTARGCPFGCAFCDSHKLWTRKVRYHSAEYIVEEIQELKERHGVRLFVFDDDTFALDSKLCDELLELMIKRNLKVSWRCETRVNLVKEPLLKKMKRAGCKSITVGIESGNDETLKKIKKGVTKKQIKDACYLIKKNGILLNCFFMFGFPWETEKDLQETLNFLRTVKPDGEVGAVHSYFVPYPGTELFEIVKKSGLLPDIPLHKMHHLNRRLKFTPHISEERFMELTKEIDAVFGAYNRKIRRWLPVKNLAYFILNVRQRGMLRRESLHGFFSSLKKG